MDVCVCDLFERALHVDALVPGCRGVGQAVSGVAPTGDVHLLPAEVPEGFCHHHHAIICQCRRVLEKERVIEVIYIIYCTCVSIYSS